MILISIIITIIIICGIYSSIMSYYKHRYNKSICNRIIVINRINSYFNKDNKFLIKTDLYKSYLDIYKRIPQLALSTSSLDNYTILLSVIKDIIKQNDNCIVELRELVKKLN